MAAKLSFARALAASAWREWQHLRRSPWDIAQTVWIPCVLLLVVALTFGATFLRQIPVAVVDDDQSSVSRQLVRRFDAAPGLRVAARPLTLDEAQAMARRLDVYAVIYLPGDLARKVARGETGSVLTYYNASYLATGQTAAREVAAVVQASGAELGRLRGGRVAAQAAPVRVQSNAMFNPERSYEHFLVGLILPAILHLGLALAVIGALGRELRDGTATSWLDASGQRLGPAVLGKVLPYGLLFMLYGVCSLVWVAGLRGAGVAGSAVLLLAGMGLMYLAYAAVGLLMLGVTRSMALALAGMGLFAGVSLAFSGATFPLIGAPWFARFWSALLPFTAYVELLAQQGDMGAPVSVSLWPLGRLLAFVLLPGIVGYVLFGRAARDPRQWGRR